MRAAAAGEIILAPNLELARALSDAIERLHQAAGREIWPTPRVYDFGGWLRQQHSARLFEDAALPRLLGDIDEREVWRAVVDSSAAGADILEPSGAARAARRARRAMSEYGIALPALAAQAGGSDEVRVFLGWNRSFEERCSQLGCVSADDLLKSAAAPAEPLAWIESPAWHPAARLWLTQHGRVLMPDAVHSSAQRVACASPETELAAIADWALQKRQASPAFRAWICIPDLTLRRAQVIDAFDAALAPHRFVLSSSAGSAAYAVAGGTPLAEFAPVRAALQMLAACVDQIPFEGFSRLLRAPEMNDSAAEAGAAALLDVRLRTDGPHEAALAGWLALSERIAAARRMTLPAAIVRLRSAMREMHGVQGSQPLSRWVVAWIAALHEAPWALRQRWTSTEYQAAERFSELLGELAMADAILGNYSQRAALGVLQRAARDTSFQIQTGIPPIWVSGQIVDPWLNYDALWISGCDSERWPPAIDPIPLLPLRLQREAGVVAAAAESQLRFASDMQLRWQARAPECTFSYSNPSDERFAVASPLLETMPLRSASAPLRPHWRAFSAAAPLLEQLVDELAPPFPAGERVRGVGAIKAQSNCAFRAFAEMRLLADRLESPAPGFDARERGQLIHRALQHFWTATKDSQTLNSMDPVARRSLLGASITLSIEEQCRHRDPGARWRRREQERLHAVLDKWLDAEGKREPFMVDALEQDNLIARHADLAFEVRIDRIDRLLDGSRVLIDYKSGVSHADWRGDRPDNPQLPIYALLRPEGLAGVAYAQVNAAECRFVAETERPQIFKMGTKQKRSKLEGCGSLAELLEVWSGRLAVLAADFTAGRAAVAPTLRACKLCHLHGLCRVPGALEEPEEGVHE